MQAAEQLFISICVFISCNKDSAILGNEEELINNQIDTTLVDTTTITNANYYPLQFGNR